MATAGDIITAAFIKVGVESPTAAQTASALISLNNMVSLLGADMLAPGVVSEGFSLEATDPEYTIGPGCEWDTAIPLKVINCFLRDDLNADTPVRVLSSKDYNYLGNKSFSGRPSALYFLPGTSSAKIIFNTRPDVGYDAYFEFLKNFTEFATTATTVSLPAEYKEALVYNLAVSLGEDWDRVVSKTLLVQAERTRAVIQQLSAATKEVAKARFDFSWMGPSEGAEELFAGGSTEVIDGGAF